MSDEIPTREKGPAKRTAPTSRGSSAYTRKRAVIACQVCRVRRTKCDQKKPRCSFCESIGAECVSDPPALSAFDPASLAIIERLDRLENEFRRFAQGTTTAPSTEAVCPPAPRHPGEVSDLGHVLQQPVEQILQWPVFQTETSPVSLGSLSPQSIPAYQSSRPWPETPGSTLAGLVGKETHAKLLDQFFSHVHTRNPILDEPKARQLSREVFERGIGWDIESCLSLMIWANGAGGSPLPTVAQSRKDFEQSQGVMLFHAAQQRLGLALAHTSVQAAQCFFLAGVFLMSAIRPFHAWRMFSQALATCRIIKRARIYDQDDIIILESVTWSAWKSERELNRELRMLPRPPDFDMPQDFPSPPASCRDELLQTWYFYLSEISAWRLETRVQEECTRLAPQLNGNIEEFTEIADNLTQQVSDWQNSLASEVSITDDHEDEDMLRLILKARALYIFELISWPFVYALLHDRIQPESQRAKDWTARALDYHLQKLCNHSIQFYHRHHGTWLMIRSCARSICVFTAASQLPFAKSLLPVNWQGAVNDALQMLRFWHPELNELGEIFKIVDALPKDP